MATASTSPARVGAVETHRVGNPALVGTLAAVSAGAMAIVGLGVAYLTSRQSAGVWSTSKAAVPADFDPATLLATR